MDKLTQFVKHLKAFDVVVIVFYIILSVLHIIFYERIDTWMMWIIVNLCIIIISFLLAYLESKYRQRILERSSLLVYRSCSAYNIQATLLYDKADQDL